MPPLPDPTGAQGNAMTSHADVVTARISPTRTLAISIALVLHAGAFALLIASTMLAYLPCSTSASMFWPFACCEIVCS